MNLDDLINSVSTNLGVSTDTDVEKQASETVSAETTLEEMLTKSASTNESQLGETPQMNKQANEQGIALANAILDTLVKQANSVVAETGAQVMQDDQKIQNNVREEQTVTDVLQNHILKAIADGASQENAAVAAGAPAEAAAEGAAQNAQPAIEGGAEPMPSGPMMGVYGGPSMAAEVEKAAAVSELVAQGRGFEDAVALVKQAAEAIAAEEMEMAKVAAATTLVKEAGVSLDEAVALVNFGIEKMAAEASEKYQDPSLAGLRTAVKGAIGGGATGAAIAAMEGRRGIKNLARAAAGGAGLGGSVGQLLGGISAGQGNERFFNKDSK